MHQVQETLLDHYRKLFPQATYKNIAEQTKIQMTRVFRIFNGSEMKLQEYLVFSRIIQEKNDEFSFNSTLVSSIKQSLHDLSPESLKSINHKIQRHKAMKKLVSA